MNGIKGLLCHRLVIIALCTLLFKGCFSSSSSGPGATIVPPTENSSDQNSLLISIDPKSIFPTDELSLNQDFFIPSWEKPNRENRDQEEVLNTNYQLKTCLNNNCQNDCSEITSDVIPEVTKIKLPQYDTFYYICLRIQEPTKNKSSKWLSSIGRIKFISAVSKVKPIWNYLQGNQLSSVSIIGLAPTYDQNAYISGRIGAIHEQNNNQVHWIFSGYGYDKLGNRGMLNDLWSYDPQTNAWKALGGDQLEEAPGNYGIKGIADSNNWPGARSQSTSWLDSKGQLWIFGGYGFGDIKGESGELNDLWMFDGELWTWKSGNSKVNSPGVYGQLGVTSNNNTPGARTPCASWVDEQDQLWLFGGQGHDSLGIRGPLNDLWMFSPITNQWTWVQGSDLRSQTGKHSGILGQSSTNIPGARLNCSGHEDSQGNFWLFGGYGHDSAGGYGYLNDVWTFPANGGGWIWVAGSDVRNAPNDYGTIQIPDSTNTPSARNASISWIDQSDQMWIFGGYGYDTNQQAGYLNDVWKFDTTSLQWTWMGGGTAKNSSGIYDDNQTSLPGGRKLGVGWSQSDEKINILGGYGLISNGDTFYINDHWSYDVSNSQWSWIEGGGKHLPKGNYNSNMSPGPRESYATWFDSNNKQLLLFGGFGYDQNGFSGALNDLWRYDLNNKAWEWVHGSSMVNQKGVFGTKGVADALNTPSARYGQASWPNNHESFYLYGGYGIDQDDNVGMLGDLWKYQTGSWTWIKGNSTKNQGALYTNDDQSTPGARYYASTWSSYSSSSSPELWLFGGYGYDQNSNLGMRNDLWKFDGQKWNWIWGDQNRNALATYGELGIAHIDNGPGSRYGSILWGDSEGTLWLFGGWGYDKNNSIGYLADLWQFKEDKWAWIAGDTTKFSPTHENAPGSRYLSLSWVDQDGQLWLYGGRGFDIDGNLGFLNDLWVWNHKEWKKVNSSSVRSQMAQYLEENQLPGARAALRPWIDPQEKKLWFFGGAGHDKLGVAGTMSDLWQINLNNSSFLQEFPLSDDK